jgi:hypothetical protein
MMNKILLFITISILNLFNLMCVNDNEDFKIIFWYTHLSDKYEDIPVIQCDGTYKTEKWYFLLKPRFGQFYFTFKDFNEVERQKILRKLKPIYDYFERCGKLVIGTVDLSILLEDEIYWMFD